jgi:isochorismate synthase
MIIIERAKNHFANHLPFVLYRKPQDELLNGVFQLDNQWHKFTGQNGFVFQSFDNQFNYCLPDDFSTRDQELIIENHLQFSPQKYQINHANEAFIFKEIVKKAINRIENNQIEKVVISREISADLDQGFDIFKSFQNALLTYKDALVYIFYHPNIGAWLGATPELLLKTEGQTFETMSLAGTKLAQESTDWTLKEKHEQNIVTEYIISTLNNFSEDIVATEAASKQAGQLVHLHSSITGTFKEETSAMNLLQVLHPTPAVVGLPKKDALAFINENEAYERHFYTGFLGVNNVYKSEFYVNLRCLSFVNKQLKIYVGCGITKDSQPLKEFEETVNKSKTMLNIL